MFRLLLIIASPLTVLLMAGCGGDDPRAQDAAAPPAAAFESASPAQIAPRATADEVLLIDVREDAEWDAGRAPFAVHVPLGEVPGRLDEIRTLARNRSIAFICRSGSRSAQASQAAVDGGLTRIVNVDGGMGAWVDAGLPLTPEDGKVL